jgi:hypothetical protein
MAKFFERMGSQKKDFIITMRLISLTAEVPAKSFFSIQWKRGPQTEDSSVFEVMANGAGGGPSTTIINETFTRQSNIYLDTQKNRYLKKMVRMKGYTQNTPHNSQN